MHSLAADAHRGRREVMFLVGSHVLVVILLTAQAWRVTGHFPGWIHPLTLFAGITFGLLTIARHRWSRSVFVVVVGLTALSIALSALQGFIYSPAGAAVLLTVAVLVAGIAWRMQTSRYITAFFVERASAQA